MAETFYHGVEVIELDEGPRPIRTVRSAVIGLVGTAPEADASVFPLDTPVLIAGSRTEAAKLGTKGTLPQAIDGIFDQAGAMVVVVRVEEKEDENEQIAQVIGGVQTDGRRTGLYALLDAQNKVYLKPKILIAPGFSHKQAVAQEMLAIAEKLRAIAVIDGPNTTDEDAIAYRQNFGSARAYIVDPWVRVFNAETSSEEIEPASSRVAGLIARIDQERGFWWSPSNNLINGIVGTARGIDFQMGDPNCRANYLNEHEVATIIHELGFRLWGNRTASADPKFAFLSVRRTADMIEESLLYAHLWAVDRAISKGYVEAVLEGVKSYLRHLKAVGAIIDGNVWFDPELNTSDQLAQGKIYFDFDFTPPPPAEHITFRAHIVDTYLSQLAKDIAREWGK